MSFTYSMRWRSRITLWSSVAVRTWMIILTPILPYIILGHPCIINWLFHKADDHLWFNILLGIYNCNLCISYFYLVISSLCLLVSALVWKTMHVLPCTPPIALTRAHSSARASFSLSKIYGGSVYFLFKQYVIFHFAFTDWYFE